MGNRAMEGRFFPYRLPGTRPRKRGMDSMELIKLGYAGTLESSDVYVVTKPNPGKGIRVALESVVRRQFGDSILETVHNVLRELEVTDAIVELSDKGALDSVIRSRVQAAVCRSAGAAEFDWGKELERR